jgi:site-specific recombinase XerD
MITELTKSFIETGLCVPPEKHRVEYCDSSCPGLLVEVRDSASAVPTFYLRFKRNGKTAYDRLGTIRELTLTQARKLATQKKVEHAQEAKQPVDAKPAIAEMTLDTFMRDHYMPHARIHKRSHVRDDQLYRIRIKPTFGDTPLKEITRYAVQQFQNELATAGLSPASQDHHIKLFRHALNMAVQWEMLEKNVLKGIRLLNEDNQLHDVADDEQLKRLVEILKTDANRPVCHILMFLLSTGARLNEGLQARWDQVDLERGIWTIPAANAKSKRARSVPLNDSALYVLAEAGKMKQFDAIFANPETGKPYTTITRVWYRLRKLAGITKMRIHACRHQFASLLVSSGRSLYDVQVLLGHADPRVSQRYAKLSMPALQAAANTASIIVPKLAAVPPATPEAAREAGPP